MSDRFIRLSSDSDDTLCVWNFLYLFESIELQELRLNILFYRSNTIARVARDQNWCGQIDSIRFKYGTSFRLLHLKNNNSPFLQEYTNIHTVPDESVAFTKKKKGI